MLNYNAMVARLLMLTMFISLAGFGSSIKQDNIAILAPLDGEAVQGVVVIVGTTDIPGFQSADLSFSYQKQEGASWFPIAQSNKPVQNDVLAKWETNTIADGIYSIRLQVFVTGGEVRAIVVKNIRVRNYTPIETNTPAPTVKPTIDQRTLTAPVQVLITSTPESIWKPGNTPTNLPKNPLQINEPIIVSYLAVGAGAVISGLLLIGFLKSRRSRS
ncbi:MAG TPA: hypothetical protein VIO61_11820 [Anaerolineaceae bacterium]